MSEKKTYQRPKDFVDPAAPSKCTWKPGTLQPTVHSKKAMPQFQKNYMNILETIGCTPLVRLNRIPQSYGIKCEMYAKCEFMNPGGSVKDRIAIRMIEDAEAQGKISKGWTLIEPTAGNTGIGLALVAAVKGYNCIIVMPDYISIEKEYVLRALNAKVVRARSDVPYDDPRSVISVAQILAKETENSIVLDQLRNPSNPLAHYDGTGPEILWQMENKVDMIVCGAATGGTATGIARYVKEKLSSCKVIGVDPCGSYIARPEFLNKTDIKAYEVEGMGFPFPSTVIDRDVIDSWVKTTDSDTFPMCRRLILEEGLLVGGSSGAIMTGALRAAKDLNKNQRCVVILPDGIRNYMTKFVSDNWMEAKNLKELENKHHQTWWDFQISEMCLPAAMTITSKSTIKDAINSMTKSHIPHVAVVDPEDGALIGVVSENKLVNLMVNENAKLEDLALQGINRRPIQLKSSDILGKLARVLESEACVLIVDKKGTGSSIKSIATKLHFMEFLSNKYQRRDVYTGNNN